jgi:pimeloyl-ACP methyl ester carboxylesterase
MNYYEHKGARIAVNEIGEGPPMLFVHCSSASHKEWLFAADHLKARHTCLMPDLLGYGKTSSHLDAGGKPVPCDDADVVVFLLDRVKEQADLVAHSYGAVVALEAARRRQHKVKSLFLVEPVAFQLLRTDRDPAASKEAFGIAERVAAAEAAGDTRRAARIYMGYWIGLLKWTFSPRFFKRSVLKSVPKVAHEFRYLSRQDAPLAGYADLSCPVTLVKGGKSTRAAHAVIDVLAADLPNCRVTEIAGAGHMSPFTHSAEVFELLCRHLGRPAHERPESGQC